MEHVAGDWRRRAWLRPGNPWLRLGAVRAGLRINKRAKHRQGRHAIGNHMMEADEQGDGPVGQTEAAV